MRKGGITRSTGFQVFLYFLLAAGALCGCFCILIAVWFLGWNGNKGSFAEFERRLMTNEAYQHLDYIWEDWERYPQLDDVIEAFQWESKNNNVKFAIFDVETGEIVWTNTSSYNIKIFYEYESWNFRTVPMEEIVVTFVHEVTDAEAQLGEVSEYIPEANAQVTDYILSEGDKERAYRAVLYVDPASTKNDTFKEIHEMAKFWYYEMDLVYMGAVGGCLLALISLIWILCNAGHRWRREGIVPGVLSNIYLDILTGFFGLGALFILLVADNINEVGSDYFLSAAFVAGVATVEVVWCTFYLRELALQFKLGKWWQHTLVYTVWKLFRKLLGLLWKGIKALVKYLPEIHLVIIALLFLTGCEFLGIMQFVRWGKDELLVCWFFEKILVTPVILYCAMAFQKLRKGSRAMAQGDLSGKVDTRYLMLHFKEHGEDLNQIGTGISKAVEERLQSERLKTELITNVSHDLKTPLTSVINYADLLAVAATGEDDNKETQIVEYSEVLLRQAKRLKKLLEDLVEASKAATGNVELVLVPCELGVMLTQAAGEYEERFAQKELKLVMKNPEEEVRILADGRQLWRVFENLLNNICKYAQEGSRVYLSMECKDNRVEVIFRNISKYELEISPAELTERFVRGDASRHMEGSGLGLSIAKSLTELQNGTMEILTDGDLFKVILGFEIYNEK